MLWFQSLGTDCCLHLLSQSPLPTKQQAKYKLSLKYIHIKIFKGRTLRKFHFTNSFLRTRITCILLLPRPTQHPHNSSLSSAFFLFFIIRLGHSGNRSGSYYWMRAASQVDDVALYFSFIYILNVDNVVTIDGGLC